MEKLKVAGGYILICIIWGSTWLAIRLGLDSIDPIISVGIRFLLASGFIYFLMKFNDVELQVDKKSVKIYLMLAFFSFIIPFGLVYWAEQFIPSGLASILFAIMPFGVIIFSRLMMPQNRVGLSQLAGVALGFAGIVIIFSENIHIEITNYLWGMIAVLVSSMMQAFIAVAMKKHGGHLHPLSMNFLPLLIAGIVLIPIAFIFETPSRWIFDAKSVGSILYLAFFGTVVTFTTYYWLLKRMNVVILSLSAFITPIIAVVLGWLILDEYFSQRVIMGSSLVLIGILFANFKGLIKYFHMRRSRVNI
ncbi:DMT superfamily drug/metaboltie permease [Melioribacter roseus P3M-2]|uniref:DMT superfamily drug/metaboltie permease n=1 Tax=Melioribacter roseus (strain DSM 23840 / JCM 17771 / VKM B-2668 / P3M-2) TaxID=1191523 RepID=I6ZMY8_MELRP|nr:EamA family transporter [Melioribacter roseus]AFN73389.1 DMT superfamily drug/metaboltie permease [Melioribacter roseus P3M-2]